jgi:hypothetical protein
MTENGLDAGAWRRQDSGGASRDSIIAPGKLSALTDWGIICAARYTGNA